MANADIDPPEQFLNVHPDYTALLVNAPVSTQFAAHEQTAVQAKRIYTLLGFTSLGAAALTMTALIYALTLDPSLASNLPFQRALGIVGGIGILAQIGLLATPIKRRWLSARFAAERLRGIKFQAVAHAAQAGDDYEPALKAFVDDAIGRLAVELDRPRAAMHEFDPESFIEPAASGPPLSAAKLAELKDIYAHLRLDYQIAHARHCIEQIKAEKRLPASASELSFWSAAGLGFLDFVLAAFGVEIWAAERHFLTLFLFVVSALLFVFERGRSHNEALERYEDYATAMQRVAGALEEAKDVGAFVTCVRRGERVAMRELKAFSRESLKSTYLF